MGGRGPSAAIMDSVDAANLLIAVVAAPINGPAIVSSAATCELYSKLRFGKKISTPTRQWHDVFPSLARLSSDHTFAEALTALLDAERTDESQKSSQGEKYWHFDLHILAPIPFAEIHFAHPKVFIELGYNDEFPEEEERWPDWHRARTQKF